MLHLLDTAVTRNPSVPMYVGLMLHAQARKRDLVEKARRIGLSISYDRVFSLSAQLGNGVRERFEREKVVCPPKLCGGIFTTAAVDNIDHNPSSTTSKDSFYGISDLPFPASQLCF